MITVKVIHEQSGEPWENKKVALSFDGLLSGGVTNDEYTDSRGEAHFDYKPGNGKVYVNGDVAFKGYLSGRIVVYV